MNQRTKQIIVILGAVILFGILYFGLDTKPKKQKVLEKSRAANIEATGIQNIVMNAKKTLSAEDLSIVEAMQTEYQQATTQEEKVEKAKALSSQWYQYGAPIVSGYYAEEIAKLLNDKDSWSITGTTYSIGMNNATTEKEVLFARGRAIKALEKAISLDDKNVNDRINLALIYVEKPDKNPMQGILMLRKLNESYPDNVKVINQLARLSLRTNQIDNAIKRLTSALSIEPNNNTSICLMAEAQQRAGNSVEAERFNNICKK